MGDSLGSLLVVEDDALNRDMVIRRLERRGYRVDPAADGTTALAQINKRSYDLVLLDIVMPDLDGIQVLKQVRQHKSRAELPVIMVTGKDETQDIVAGLREGANDYVTKPIDMEVLLARIGTHVILKRTAESLAESNRRLEQANAQLRRDLEAAAKIQRSHLPAGVPTFRNCDFAWKYEPCEQLGGDNLNIMALTEDQIGFYVLDVSGHGVQAALMSVAINHLLEPSKDDTSVVNRPNRRRQSETEPAYLAANPHDVAVRLNRHFVFDLSVAQYFTILYGVLDLRDRVCRYVSTGHPPPIHLTNQGEIKVLESSGLPVGIFQEGEPGYEPFEERTIELKSGDRLYIYSDGVVEAKNRSQQQFGIDGLMRVLQDNRGTPLALSLDVVFSAVRDWCAEEPLDDDLSMLALDVR
jgi:phosphoserine phosphatase RsbU/P